MKVSGPFSKVIAGAPVLSFLNAISPAPHQKLTALRTGVDLLEWLEAQQLISATERKRLLDEAGQSDLDALAADAVGLGEWFRGFLENVLGQRLSAAHLSDLEPLNMILACGGHFRIVEQIAAPAVPGVGLRLAPRRRWFGAATVLQPIAESMASLVCDRDFPFIRRCDGPGCGLLFIDRTRARARRWCSMAQCGNRAKQVAHRSAANENGY